MFILKNLKHHRAGKISHVVCFHIILRLSILLLTLQIPLPFASEQSLVWGLGFDSAPQVIDNADEDSIFSPNGDGEQDKLLISFAGDGSLGDFRIIIDVHGPGGIGPPDGIFNPDDDWQIIGPIGSGVADSDSPKVIRREWDGKDRSPEQDSPPTARTVKDGTYDIRVDIDAHQDGRLSGVIGYISETSSGTIDTIAPQSSLQVSLREISPNADGSKDSTVFTYSLSEDVTSLQLKFIESDIPSILLNGRPSGRYTYTWNGADGFGIPLSDGSYNLQLRGSDNAGNIGEFTIGAITIDTAPPSISQLTPSGNTFQNTPISVIQAIINPDGGSPIDFAPAATMIVLKYKNRDSIAGSLSRDESENRLTLTLNSPLDDVDENGVYTVTATAFDLAGNSVQRIAHFTFDTSPPIVTKLTANGTELRPGAAFKTPLVFVDALLVDNIALNRNASTIRLNGPDGGVDGVQSPVGANGIRWMLSFPLKTDGTDDGTYTLIASPVDAATNEGSQRQISIVYDTQPPRLISLLPIEVSEPQTFRNTPISLITAAFDDENGSGVNLNAATIEMGRQVDAAGTAPIAGVMIPDVNNNTLAFRLNQPLQVRDGSQDGAYNVQVSFIDKVGNSQTADAVLIFDTQAPVLISTTPADNEIVSSLSNVSVRLDDATSGIDFSSTTVRLIHGGNEVSVDTSDNGHDAVALTLAKPLASDGSDDGEYTIEIIPADRAGNAGTARINRFFFDTRIPEIQLITPSNPQISTLTTIEAQLLGYTGPGIHLSPVLHDGVLRDRSTIYVIAPDGRIIPSKEVTADTENARLMWTIDTPLARNGSADGVYTVNVRYEDFAGSSFTEDFTFTFDTQIPTIASTTPGAGDFVARLNQVVVKFNPDLSGMDLGAAQVRLIQPDGTPILSNISNDGRDTIKLQFNPLRTDGTADGIYAIEVNAADRAGNIADAPSRFEFTYATQIPEIRLNSPSETKISNLTTVEAQLLRYSGAGINFSPVLQDGVLRPKSTIQVIAPDGRLVPPKEVTADAENARLMWTIDTPLPRDGSADGEYTVNVRYEDFTGSSFTEDFTFTFDTQIPTIASTTPSAGDFVSRLSQVLVKFESDLSGVDLAASQVRIIQPDGTPILSNVSDNGHDTIVLQFNPLRTDGTADGIYAIEVTSADRAGNVAGAPFRLEFTFVTQTPEIAALVPADNAIVNRVQEITATLIDNSGSGIDFSQSTIILKDANEERIVGVLRNDGALTLTLEAALPTDGVADGEYTIELHLVDELGTTAVYTRRFLYDSQPPAITPESRMPTDSATNRNHIEVEFEVVDPAPRTAKHGVVGSGVDFSATEVQLLSPDNNPIDGEKTYDGISLINFTSAVLPSAGTYTLVVTLMDVAGNRGIPQSFTITYDMEIPVLEALNVATPSRVIPIGITGGVSNISGLFTRVEAVLSDDSAGIDFTRTSVQLLNLDGETVAGVLNNDSSETVWWLLDTPLQRNGDADGLYSIRVQAFDKAGNLEDRAFTLHYDTQAPNVHSIRAVQIDGESVDINLQTPVTIARPIQQLAVAFSDGNGSGLDHTRTTVRMMAPNGDEIGGNQTDDGAGAVYFSFNPLRADGSDDGRYRIQVTPTDLAGNTFSSPIEIPFFYSTRIPEIVSTTPAEFSTVTQLTSVSAALLDHSGEGIDFDHSAIQLTNPNGNLISTRMRADESTSTLTLELDALLPRNGDADGEYTIGLTIADKAGNLVEESTTFIYDTQIPQIVSVTANTEPPTQIRPEHLHIIDSTLSEITVKFSDVKDVIMLVSGVDLTGTEVRLVSPQETQVDVHTRDDGVDTMTISFSRLNRSGAYTLEITPRDRAGNFSGHAIPFRFRIELAPPRVDTVTIGVHSAPVEFVNALHAITSSLLDVSGVGLDLTSDGSNISVVGPNGEVDGTLSTSGTNEIVWMPLQLAADGTMDGTYTATITPVDSAGEAGVPARHQFIFDTQPPSLIPKVVTQSRVIPLDVTGDAPNISDLLTQVEADLSDDNAGINFQRTSIQLLNPDGEAVPGNLDNDSRETIWWLLDTPLPRNGDADGTYLIRVQAFDKAGNLKDSAFNLRYDTQVPNVRSIRAEQIDGTTIDIHPEVPTTISSPIQRLTVEFLDGEGSGMDLSNTAVRLVGQNGSEIGGNQTDNGAETIFFRFNPFPADGSADGRYRIQVTPTDLAGNTFSSPIEFPFFYSTHKPEIVSTTPAEFSTVTQFTSVSAALLDHSGEGIDFDNTAIRLQAPNGNLLPARTRAVKSTSTLTLELDSPLPRNGEADGEYIIGLTVADNAGNRVEASRTFVYDTQIPQIVSVTAKTEPPAHIQPEQLQIINRSLSQITVRFSDANDEITSVSGVDLVGTDVRLIAQDETQVDIHARDDGVDTMIISFSLLNRSGAYTLEITPRDRAGNVSGHAIPFRFRIELAPPRVDLVTIGGHSAPVEFVNALDAITASLVDVSGVGLDLTSDGSNITVVGPHGEVDGILAPNGTNQIVWTPLQIAADGTMDGTYTTTITPVDSAGGLGVPARHQFVFDTQPPSVSGITPINLTEPVSYIGAQISQIAALVADVGPAGLSINEQRLHLLDEQENLIPGDLTNDGAELVIFTLSQPFAADGTDDGAYTVVLVLSDKADNLSGIAHQLVYDTIAPTVNTHPADGDAISDDIRTITADLHDTGDSGIDFDASTLSLLDAIGVEITGEPSNDGRGRLTLQIPGLVEDGNYTIRVVAVDRAGNGADAPFTARFLFSSSIPAVVSTVPATSPPERAFTNRPLRQVQAQLRFEGGGSDRSTISLLAPDGTPVAGIQTETGTKLVYRLSRPLAADGSDDGMYTISVIPVNRAGRQGATRQFTFAYDTIPPEVDPNTVSLIVADPGVNNALNEIQVRVTDNEPSSGIDWDNLAESWLMLENIETGRWIRGTLNSDDQETLSFRLAAPLASDGSQDGEYRVTIVAADRAKNISEPVMYDFTYDTRPPIVITHSLEVNDQPLLYDRDHPDYPSATNSITGVVIRARLEDFTRDGGRGLGADLSQSTITLRDPEDNPINGSLRQNGVDTIEFKSDALTVEGLYQVTITSVGLDEANLGFQPRDSISTEFLHERTEPVVALTDFGRVTTLENQPMPLSGTAHDPETDDVAASGVLLVEIIGVGPDGVQINPVPAHDESEAEEEPWSSWSVDFLPTQSGIYNLDIRATDHAGNVSVADGVKAAFSVSLSFKGSTYVWPNPVRHSVGDTANFSFDINAPNDEALDLLLSIYDFAGDLVYYEEFQDIRAGRTDQLVTWNLENQAGADVARGVYIFRLQAQRTGVEDRTNVVGKILVVE